MIRQMLLGLMVSAAILCGALTSHAVVIVNDTWKDGTRTDLAAPNYSENGVDLDLDGDVESAWYRGGAGTDQAFLAPVAPGGPLRLDLTPNLAISSSLTTYFAPEASPVTIGVGEQLKITFVFTPTLVTSEGIDMSGTEFRIGVVNSPSDARISTDVSPATNSYTGYCTMINMTNTTFQEATGIPFQLMERSVAGPLLSSYARWTMVGNGATNGNPSFTSGTQYTYTFEATHTAAGELDLYSRMAGTGLDGDGLAEVHYLDPTPNAGSFSFDTFAIRMSNAYTSASVLDISLFKVELISPPSALPGDVNNDGIVNGLDISLVASHWLQTGDPSSLAGDANGDGVVNGLDISLIASHWLQGGSANAAAVPEPGSLVLLGLGTVLGAGYVRRARRTASGARNS